MQKDNKIKQYYNALFILNIQILAVKNEIRGECGEKMCFQKYD